MLDYNNFFRVLVKITSSVNNISFNNFENKDFILILIFLNSSFFLCLPLSFLHLPSLLKCN